MASRVHNRKAENTENVANIIHGLKSVTAVNAINKRRPALGELSNKVGVNQVGGGVLLKKPIAAVKLNNATQIIGDTVAAAAAKNKVKVAVKTKPLVVSSQQPTNHVIFEKPNEHKIKSKHPVVQKPEKVSIIKPFNPTKCEKQLKTIESHAVDKAEADPLVNVDDNGDPQLAPEYIQAIHKYMQQHEKCHVVDVNFLKNHKTNSTCRRILVDWLMDVQSSTKLLSETLYMAVSVLDSYLQLNKSIGRDQLQLVGVTAMHLAAKYEEVYPPGVNDLVFLCDNAFTKDDVLQMERKMAYGLNFDFSRPLSIQFVRQYCRIASIKPEVYTMAKYFLEATLMDHITSSVTSSLKAAAACCLSMAIFEGFANPKSAWTPTLQHYTCFNYTDLKPVILRIATYVNGLPKLKQRSVREKFSTAKFFAVSGNPKLSGPLMTKLVHEASLAGP